MRDLEQYCMQIISKAGAAKSICFEALNLAQNGKFDGAQDMLKKASDVFLDAHLVHGELITLEASGELKEITLLLLHAEDQLMSAETTKDLITEMIKLYKRISD